MLFNIFIEIYYVLHNNVLVNDEMHIQWFPKDNEAEKVLSPTDVTADVISQHNSCFTYLW